MKNLLREYNDMKEARKIPRVDKYDLYNRKKKVYLQKNNFPTTKAIALYLI